MRQWRGATSFLGRTTGQRRREARSGEAMTTYRISYNMPKFIIELDPAFIQFDSHALTIGSTSHARSQLVQKIN